MVTINYIMVYTSLLEGLLIASCKPSWLLHCKSEQAVLYYLFYSVLEQNRANKCLKICMVLYDVSFFYVLSKSLARIPQVLLIVE